MPSILVGNPLNSGGQIIVSGNFWSGQGAQHPQGGVQFFLSPSASGNVYLGLSGGTTLTSGGMFLSGGGLSDGMMVTPGSAYWVPRLGFATSGAFTVYARHDAACSGQARLFWEVF